MDREVSRLLFLKSLYGEHFNRETGDSYRKPCYNFKELLTFISQGEEKGVPCYCSVYDYNHNNLIPLKKPKLGYIYPYAKNVILDKIFFDFDLDYNQAAIDEINNRITKERKQEFIIEIMEYGRLKPPINEAKLLANHIIEVYGGDPLLVFSGCKGCHEYIFFKPVKLQHPKETVKRFVNHLEHKLKLKTVDQNVKGDLGRIAKIPSSLHPETGLYANPFILSNNYDEIIQNSKNRDIFPDNIDIESKRSQLDHILISIDRQVMDEMEYIRYKSQFRILNNKGRPTERSRSKKIDLNQPEDILKLNIFSCFRGSALRSQFKISFSLYLFMVEYDSR